jgi:hypothetical protein
MAQEKRMVYQDLKRTTRRRGNRRHHIRNIVALISSYVMWLTMVTRGKFVSAVPLCPVRRHERTRLDISYDGLWPAATSVYLELPFLPRAAKSGGDAKESNSGPAIGSSVQALIIALSSFVSP